MREVLVRQRPERREFMRRRAGGVVELDRHEAELVEVLRLDLGPSFTSGESP